MFIIKVDDINGVEDCVKIACKKCKYRKYKEVFEIDIDVLKEVMSDCNDFINQMAKKLENKLNKKDFNVKISRMKKKTDKYFIYMSKNNIVE